MKLKTFLFDEDRGVSPVIGVILMVAITVILAAVIATFVMNMGPSENTMPNAQLDGTASGTEFTISHSGGESVQVDDVDIEVDGTSSTDTYEFTGTSAYSTGDELTASDSLILSTKSGASGSNTIDVSASVSTNGDPFDEQVNSVSIIWQNPDSGETQILADWEP